MEEEEMMEGMLKDKEKLEKKVKMNEDRERENVVI